MNWNGKNILITGSTGFVGSWLSKALVERKANVIVLVKTDAKDSLLKYMGTYPKLKAVVRGDIIDYNSMKSIFDKYEIDTCFHLAAQAIVGTANQSPTQTFETNIKGTWNMLEVARVCKVERLIVASTDKVYGEPIKLPITEEHPLLASYPYDASKACADILSRTYFKTYGLPVGVTRCCNIYGGGDLNFSRIVPDTVRSIVLNKNPTIRSDGTPVRDFIYITDAISGYLTLAENLDREKIKGEAFNFGSNSPIKIIDLVNLMIKISGKDLKPEILGKGKPKAEIGTQYLSIEKARNLLNWRPKFSLEEGFEETIKWYEEYFKST
ncbi:MAG: GDP-mannose 4,6-dehydratase [Asgard group archaeon]